MPTRSVDVRVLQRAFDLLVPPGSIPKQYLRWKELSRRLGMGEHWIRKRYQDRDRSELELTTIGRIRRALEASPAAEQDERLKRVIATLARAQEDDTIRLDPHQGHAAHEFLRLRVVNVAFVRSSNANYCQRLEAGIRFGMLEGLQDTHLINDESVDLTGSSPAARLRLIQELLSKFETDPSYVDRTYLVPLGTVAASAVCRYLHRDRALRDRVGKDLRVIFAGVTAPETTGLLEFNRDYVGGMYAGTTFAERLQFISEAFPDQPISFLCDPSLPQDSIARNHVVQCHHPNVQIVNVRNSQSTRLSAETRRSLVTGYTVINWHIHEFVRKYPDTAFIGVNTSDMGLGAVASTGNDDLRFGIMCARRLMVPDCRNEINLRDLEIIRPEPVYGLNQKACNLHGLVPRIAARKKCRVIVE